MANNYNNTYYVLCSSQQIYKFVLLLLQFCRWRERGVENKNTLNTSQLLNGLSPSRVWDFNHYTHSHIIIIVLRYLLFLMTIIILF